MIYLIIYLVLSFIWSIYSVYRTRQMGYLGKLISNQIQVFILNFVLFPYCLYYAIKHKKI